MIEKKNLLILGAGQYGNVAKETAQAMGCFDKIDFLDDRNCVAVGQTKDYLRFVREYRCAFVAMGNPELRLGWLEKLEAAGYELAVLIHPMAWVSPSARLAPGVMVEPMVVVQAQAEIGRGSLICAGAVVNHNAVVAEGCQIDCSSVVPSNTKVGPMTKISCGSVAGEAR